MNINIHEVSQIVVSQSQYYTVKSCEGRDYYVKSIEIVTDRGERLEIIMYSDNSDSLVMKEG